MNTKFKYGFNLALKLRNKVKKIKGLHLDVKVDSYNNLMIMVNSFVDGKTSWVYYDTMGFKIEDYTTKEDIKKYVNNVETKVGWWVKNG